DLFLFFSLTTTLISIIYTLSLHDALPIYYVKSFDKLQEIGVFLEVSEKLANDSRVYYPALTPWFKPNAVFLSGYSQSDRKKIVRSEEHTSELQSRGHLVCRLLLEKKNKDK